MSYVRISNSMTQAMGKCSTLAALRTLGYGSTNVTPKKLVAGVAIHAGLEQWLQGASPEVALTAFSAGYKDYSDNYLNMEDAYYHDNLKRILSVFIDRNPLSSAPFEVIETEQQTQFELLPGIKMTDKADGLVRRNDGTLWVLEHKTTRSISDTWRNHFLLDGQVSAHTYAARQRGLDVKGVIINAIQINKLPAIEDRKCKTCHIPQRVCWPAHVHSVFLPPFQRSDKQLAEWLSEQQHIASRYEDLVMGIGSSSPIYWSAIAQEGLVNGSCYDCEFTQFCIGHRSNLGGLFEREREDGIFYSGIVSE